MTTLAIPRPVHPTGIWSWITTIDHKRIGVLYGVTAFLMFFSGGIEAFLIRVQLARPEQNLITPEIFNQLFTMHATTMIFLGVMPSVGRILQLRRTAADRRQRRSVPSPECLQLLDFPGRRPASQDKLVHSLRAERRLVRILSAYRHYLQPRARD